MNLIIGLGNPGKQYDNSRHNTGFSAVDLLVKEMNLPKFQQKDKFKAEVSIGEINYNKVIVAKPQTFMNKSGAAVQALVNFYKIQHENLIVVYDELDLPLGEIRVRTEGSSAGHNGIKSVMEYLSTDEFSRVRIGVRNKSAEKMPADKFVLSKLSFLEKRKMKREILPLAVEEVIKLIK